MRDAGWCGLLFAGLALFFGWLTWSAVRWREIPSKYGGRLTPETAPRRFWLLVGFQGLIVGLAGVCAAAFFLAALR